MPGAGGGDDFGYDPDWDDDWDIDRSLLDDDEAEGEGAAGGDWDEDGVVRVDVAALGVVPSSDEEVQELTKSWVQAGERRERRSRFFSFFFCCCC